MSLVSDLATRVLERLEEDPAAPVFWTLNEVYTAVVEAMNEASLVTGVVQVTQDTLVTLPPDATFLPLPQNAVALLRIQGPPAVRKTDLFSLDAMAPNWQTEGGKGSKVQQIRAWFPLGLTGFGIYPKLAVEQQVRVTYLAYPVSAGPDYTGAEPVPFQREFEDGLEEYITHVLRLKESGYEFQASQQNYQQFLDTMRGLSVLQSRRDSLIFAGATGARASVTAVNVR